MTEDLITSLRSDYGSIVEIRYYWNREKCTFKFLRRIIYKGKGKPDQVKEISYENILEEQEQVAKRYEEKSNLEKEENLLYRFGIWGYFNTLEEILNDIKDDENNKLIMERKINAVKKIEKWILKKCQEKRKMIILEGGIGVGKTCIAEKLKEEFLKMGKTVKVLHETVDEWRDSLEEFYKNPLKYQYQLEMEIIKSRNKQLRSCNRISEIVIMDRTPLSSYFFMLLGNEPATFEDWIKYYKESIEMEKERNLLKLETAKIIKIEMTAEECLERIKQRGRHEEKNVSLEYLGKLNEIYKHDLINVYEVNIDQILFIENEKGKLNYTVCKIMEFIQER
ncbi:P-loop containing nucleoside triphosphate hydrolase protein [Glomus cerebriforme]|uniref:P-loop containing nucleoside triphosphate hydrolase protein n=1 Tax=Glomus cerebriforme TaxID=658196 RepID=A0A397TMQ8_9GLOM|nr:P-loop containing nucleoside triphosphate hydrolase protein [Glomus cerebriforme]